MPTIPLKTVSDLYQKARRKREWWHNGGRGYSAYMFTDGQFLLAHDGSVIFDYDPRKGTYAVSGSTPADRDAIDSMFRILGIKDAASNLNGPISLKNGRVQGKVASQNKPSRPSAKPTSSTKRPRKANGQFAKRPMAPKNGGK